MQKKTTVTAHFLGKHLLLFVIALHLHSSFSDDQPGNFATDFGEILRMVVIKKSSLKSRHAKVNSSNCLLSSDHLLLFTFHLYSSKELLLFATVSQYDKDH